jgi:hypothetical protein
VGNGGGHMARQGLCVDWLGNRGELKTKQRADPKTCFHAFILTFAQLALLHPSFLTIQDNALCLRQPRHCWSSPGENADKLRAIQLQARLFWEFLRWRLS